MQQNRPCAFDNLLDRVVQAVLGVVEESGGPPPLGVSEDLFQKWRLGTALKPFRDPRARKRQFPYGSRLRERLPDRLLAYAGVSFSTPQIDRVLRLADACPRVSDLPTGVTWGDMLPAVDSGCRRIPANRPYAPLSTWEVIRRIMRALAADRRGATRGFFVPKVRVHDAAYTAVFCRAYALVGGDNHVLALVGDETQQYWHEPLFLQQVEIEVRGDLDPWSVSEVSGITVLGAVGGVVPTVTIISDHGDLPRHLKVVELVRGTGAVLAQDLLAGA